MAYARSRGSGHAVVVEAEHRVDRLGILSALDIAGVLAWGEALKLYRTLHRVQSG